MAEFQATKGSLQTLEAAGSLKAMGSLTELPQTDTIPTSDSGFPSTFTSTLKYMFFNWQRMENIEQINYSPTDVI